MKKSKTAREVLLSELHNWLKENSELTWHHGSELYGKGGFGQKTCPVIKYIHPHLDTRDMKIYHLTTSGVGNYCVDFREEFDGTILDLLKYKIENKITLPDNVDSF